MNRGARWMASALMPWIGQLPPAQPINLLDAMLHPEGMTRLISNLDEVAPAMLAHLRADASAVPEIPNFLDTHQENFPNFLDTHQENFPNFLDTHQESPAHPVDFRRASHGSASPHQAGRVKPRHF